MFLSKMDDFSTCLGHHLREDRSNVINKLTAKLKEVPDQNCRVVINKGPLSVETSLLELEDSFKENPEWTIIEKGGVLTVPVEELRMTNPPKPDRSGQLNFQNEKGCGKQINNYPAAQSIESMDQLVVDTFQNEYTKAQYAGDSEPVKRASIESTNVQGCAVLVRY